MKPTIKDIAPMWDEKTVAKVTKWLRSKAGRRAVIKANKDVAIQIQKMKPRVFTWEELNTPFDI